MQGESHCKLILWNTRVLKQNGSNIVTVNHLMDYFCPSGGAPGCLCWSNSGNDDPKRT